MVPKRGLPLGGSYGRVRAVLTWALDHWRDFDTWCCVRSVEPLELPAYRFYNLSLFVIKEGLEANQLAELEKTLTLCDETLHPFSALQPIRVISREAREPVQATSLRDKPKYIPPWYRGEEAAFKVAQVAMKGIKTLPKMNT